MKLKPVVRRAQARQDVQQALNYYQEQQAPEAALGFIDAVEAALRHIQRHPSTGSPRYASNLKLPGLRFWICKRYPYLVFYYEQADYIDVWRVLHSKRDIPAWLQDESGP